MEQINRALDFYRLGFRISMIVAIVGFALAVFFFFRFNIREIFLLMTGRAKAKTVKNLEERNEKTGKLRDDPFDLASEELADAPSGSLAKKQGFSRKKRSGNTGSFAIPGDAVPAKAEVLAETQPEEKPDSGADAVPGSKKDGDSGADVIPASPKAEDSGADVIPASPKAEDSDADVIPASQKRADSEVEVGATEDLSRLTAKPSFRIIEDIVVIHTDELII